MPPESSFSDPLLINLLDSLHEGIAVWTADRVLAFANEPARKITGLPMVPGTPLAPIATSVHVIGNESNDYVPSGALPVYRAFAGETAARQTIRLVKPDGSYKWLSVVADRVLDDNGELKYVISSFRDISLRKAREDKLIFMVESAKILSLNLDFKQRLREKARLTVPSLADWCMMDVLSEDGALERVATINTDPERITRMQEFERRFPRDEKRPGSLTDVIRNKKPIFIPHMTDELLASIARSPEHLEHLKSLGIRSFIVIPIVSRGEGVGAMTVAYAESGRSYSQDDFEFFEEFCSHVSVVFDNARLFHEIETRDKSKDLFLASLSHELRNPLAPIKSSMELLRMRDTPKEVREELDIIDHQFDHMARLLNDLLDVSRFTQDRISLSTKPVDLKQLIERALRGSDAVIQQADLTLHCTYPPAQLNVIADETRLEQAVSNLLSNAVKFTPAGGSIWVDLQREGSDALIRVRDNGTGIDEKDLPHVFDMYYQGVNKGFTSGLGIGLLLVQRIVSMHRGSVEAKSAGLGHGSEFIIRLPLAEINVPEPERQLPPSLARNMRILVVDDNSPAADALVRLLNKLGADARAAYSGREALGESNLDMIDLFLLDVGMPEMDGYALVKALRARAITAPIVALTGYGLAEDKERARNAGFTSHLTKPVGIRELNGLFESVLMPQL